jgi:serine/threonine-protein kinase HipA
VARAGLVFLDREPCGRIDELEAGMRFTYDPAWVAREDAQPISQTLPLRAESYECRGLHPFFAGLLPEGWLLTIALSTLKLSPADGFGLLLMLCRDCVGAVRIEPLPEAASAASEERT